MCGRFALYSEKNEIEQYLNIKVPNAYRAAYNIAPAQAILTVSLEKNPDKQKTASIRRWGLIPPWAKDIKIGYKMINARLETLLEKPAFRQAVVARRCLVPANGYFEWREEGKHKQPYFIYCQKSPILLLAGLWEQWHSQAGNQPIESVSIITQPAQAPLSSIHHRQPLVLSSEEAEEWLQTPKPLTRFIALKLVQAKLKSLSHEFAVRKVSPKMNKPSVDNPECIQAIS